MADLKTTIVWYDKNSEFYKQQALRHIPLAQINEFVRLFPKNGKVLDVGCGSGRDTFELAKKGVKVIGLDLSAGMIECAKKTYPQLEFIKGDFLNLPFEKEVFDGVWAHAAIVHLESVEDVKKALKEFNRVLKPNGIIHVKVKANLKGIKFETVKDLTGSGERFMQYFTQDEIVGYLQKAGFTVVKNYQYPVSNPKKYSKPVEWIVCLGKKIFSRY